MCKLAMLEILPLIKSASAWRYASSSDLLASSRDTFDKAEGERWYSVEICFSFSLACSTHAAVDGWYLVLLAFRGSISLATS